MNNIPVGRVTLEEAADFCGFKKVSSVSRNNWWRHGLRGQKLNVSKMGRTIVTTIADFIDWQDRVKAASTNSAFGTYKKA